MIRLGHYLLKSPLNAQLLALVFALLPFFGWPGGFMAGVVVGWVTLCRGSKAGLAVLAWVALPAIVQLVKGHYGLWDIVLFHSLFVWAGATMLASSGDWRAILEVTSLLSILAVVVFHIAVANPVAWWAQALAPQMQKVQQVMQSGMHVKLSALQVQQMLHWLASINTGVTAMLFAIAVLFQLFLARWWQIAMSNRPNHISYEITHLQMGRTAAIIMLLVTLSLCFHMPLMFDVFPVVLMPFMIAGLSLLHALVLRKKSMAVLLFVVYLTLVFMPVLIVVLLAIAGFIDSWCDFRQKMVSNA